MAAHILLVDDDALLSRSLGFSLEQAGYHVSTEATGEEALALALRDPPDLILLDIGLPGMDGLEMLHRLREHLSTPVIFLTARRRDLDQVLGFESGADDYITKPFDLDIVLARIKTVIRRSQQTAPPPSSPTSITAGDLAIDLDTHTVTLSGRAIALPPREFDLLYVLAQEAGHMVSVDDLLARVWGAEYAGEPQVVYVHIRWLREKLGDDPHHPHRIISVRRVGYKLEVLPEAKAP